jgi:hypothetical protein
MGVRVKLFKLACLFIWALLALAMMATSASAAVNLPDISITLIGGIYPMHAVGSCTKCETTLGPAAGGVTLKGEGVTLLLLTTELSALGTFTADFTKVINPSNNVDCNSSGDPAGVVLVSGEFHLVPISLAPLTLGVLYLVTNFSIACSNLIEFLEVTIRGNVLSSLEEIGSEATELTGFNVKLSVNNEDRQAIAEYYNDGGTKVKTKLELEDGSGFESAVEKINEKIPLNVLGSQMIVITDR